MLAHTEQRWANSCLNGLNFTSGPISDNALFKIQRPAASCLTAFKRSGIDKGYISLNWRSWQEALLSTLKGEVSAPTPMTRLV
jgi:hypothetical protein